jgi:hypothetical protein
MASTAFKFRSVHVYCHYVGLTQIQSSICRENYMGSIFTVGWYGGGKDG